MNEPVLDWMYPLGPDATNYVFAIATSPQGHIYVAGSTEGAFPRTANQGALDAFLVKYDATGQQLWVQELGTATDDEAIGLTTDFQGNVFIAGYTFAAFPGQVNQGDEDVFLAKYNSAGQQLWLQQIGTTDQDVAYALATDVAGNVFITGTTGGAFEGQTFQGVLDIFIAKYSSTGEQLWLKQIGTTGADLLGAIATDQQGNVFVTGFTGGTFRGEVKQALADIFLVKYSSGGEQRWLKQMGTNEFDGAYGIICDPQGNIYIAGDSGGSFPGQDHQGNGSILVVKFNTNGEQLWARQMGPSIMENGSSAQAIAMDALGNIFITGYIIHAFEGETNQGGTDVFLAKLSSAGDLYWTQQIGTAFNDYAPGIATDGYGNVYITGASVDTNSNIFLAKYVDALSPSLHHKVMEERFSQLESRLSTLIENRFAHFLRASQLPAALDSDLLQAAVDRTKGRGEHRISEAEAQEIIALAQDSDHSISNARQKTLAFIFASHSLTRGAKEAFLKALLS